jgi:O-antigen ligase
VTSFRGLADSAQPYLPQETFLKWSSIFFTLSVWTLLISLAATQAFLALSVFCYVVHLFRKKAGTGRKILFPPVKLPIAIFCLWTLVSMFFAEDPATGGFVIRKLVLFVILLVALNVVQSLRHLEYLFLGLFIEAGLAGLLSVAQFVREYLHVRALYPQRIYAHMMLTRITGFMGHWMNFSGQQMLVFISLAALLLVADARRKDSNSAPISKMKRTPGWILLAAIGLSIFLSFTRGVWLGCFVGVVYLVARRFPRWLWVLPVLVVVGYFVSPRMIRERVNQALHPSSDRSVSIRFEMWHAGWEMIKRHPWVGVGPNNVPEVYPLYLPPGKTPEIGYHDHLHDNFIQLAAERGLPCLAAWLWLMGALGWHTLRIRRKLRAVSQGIWIADAAFAGWLAFLTEGFFEFNFGTSPVLMVFLFLVTTPFVLEAVSQAAQCPQPKEA